MLARATGYSIGDLRELTDVSFMAFDAIWDRAFGRAVNRFADKRETERSGRLARLFARMKK